MNEKDEVMVMAKERQEQDDTVQWHHLDAKDVLDRLETDQHHGLAVEEAQRRLVRERPNRLVLIAIAVCALLQIAYVHTGPMQVVFHSTHLTFEEWFKIVPAGAFVFAFAEWRKRSFAAPAEAPIITHPSAGAVVQFRLCKTEPHT